MLYGVYNSVQSAHWWAGGSTWTSAQTWITTSTPASAGWTNVTAAPTGQTQTGIIRLYFQNALSSQSQTWLDAVDLRKTAASVVTQWGNVTVGEGIRLINRSTYLDEWSTVSAVGVASGRQTITFSTVPIRSYAVGDLVRHQDYWPSLMADQKDPAVTELPGAVYELKLKCREVLSGRT
jgi:hypothetical protein